MGSFSNAVTLRRTSRCFVLALLALGATVVALLLVPTTASRASEAAANGPKGAMTCDFEVSLDAPLDQIAGLLERDRIYMTREPGMLHKHVPIRPDPATGSLLAGGRYLFDTADHAADYLRWARTQFVLDGTHFFDRYYFHDVDCHSWSVIGATDFGDIHTSQVVLRTERWSVPTSNQRPFLQAHWPSIQADGNARGLTSVWLLYNRQENLASLVYFADRAAPGGPAETLDPAGLAALETAPPLGAPFDSAQGWTRTFDRTQWVFTIWFPNPEGVGDRAEPSLWPNSPPLPSPGPDDGVCEPSRGETSASAPNDCTPHCGNEVADPDEDNRRCPSDVPYS